MPDPVVTPPATAINPVPVVPPVAAAPAANPAPAAEPAVAAPAPGAEPVAAKPAAPEKYELKPPDGSHLNADGLNARIAFYKEQGLTNEQAQKHLDQEHSVVKSYWEGKVQESVRQNDVVWKEQLMSDPDVGGKAFEENGKLAFRAASHFFGDEFASVIKASNLNHYPHFFKGLVKLAKAMGDDSLVSPLASPVITKKTTAEKLYPTSNPKEGEA